MSSSYLQALANPKTLALALGMGGSSFLCFGNLGLDGCGPFAIMGEKERAGLAIRPAQAVQLWEAAYDRGM
jgi:hypothetical protein